jgi:hypothetical protein
MTDVKEPEAVRALRRIRKILVDVNAWVVYDDDFERLEAYPGALIDHIDTLTRERDDAIQSAKHSADWATSAIEDMKVSAQQRDEARAERDALRVVTDAMVERASTEYRKWSAPSLRSLLDVSTIRAILTAALSEATP